MNWDEDILWSSPHYVCFLHCPAADDALLFCIFFYLSWPLHFNPNQFYNLF